MRLNKNALNSAELLNNLLSLYIEHHARWQCQMHGNDAQYLTKRRVRGLVFAVCGQESKSFVFVNPSWQHIRNRTRAEWM